MAAVPAVVREAGARPDARLARPWVSVVVPAYNGTASLPGLLAELSRALPAVARTWEVIVVDDGSVDETPALTAGLDRAQGELVVQLDADGQHPVQLIPEMLREWRGGAMTVCAVRESRADESWAKRVGTHWFYRLVNLGAPIRIPSGAGDFRLMDRAVVDALRALPERNRFMKGLYAWVGFDTRLLPYRPPARRQGRSTFSLRPLARLAVTGLTAFSNFPLRVWSGAGPLIALGSLAYGGWIFDQVKQRPICLVAAEGGLSAGSRPPTGDDTPRGAATGPLGARPPLRRVRWARWRCAPTTSGSRCRCPRASRRWPAAAG